MILKPKVYYAHPMSTYGTQQEADDIKLLKYLKFRVLNPNEPKHQIQCKNRANQMEYFLDLVSLCDAVAFRAFQDGMIGAGVAKEIKRAKSESKPVIELPFDTTQRELSIEQTRDRIRSIRLWGDK